MKTYTKSQLVLRNGVEMSNVWIVWKGIIYDVSRSKLWRKGEPYEHWAGQDLTDELKDAPHNENVFDKFEIVGKLTD